MPAASGILKTTAPTLAEYIVADSSHLRKDHVVKRRNRRSNKYGAFKQRNGRLTKKRAQPKPRPRFYWWKVQEELKM